MLRAPTGVQLRYSAFNSCAFRSKLLYTTGATTMAFKLKRTDSMDYGAPTGVYLTELYMTDVVYICM